MVWACDAKIEALCRKEVMGMGVQWRRKRGRSKGRWLDRVRDDIKEKRLSSEEVYYRATRRRLI